MTTKERLLKVFNTVFEDEIDPETMTESANLLDDLGILSLILAMVIPSLLKNDEVPAEAREELRREVRVIENELEEAQHIEAEIIDSPEIPHSEAEKDNAYEKNESERRRT